MILVAWKLQIQPKKKQGARDDSPQTLRSNLRRIDFLGALFMSATILSAMLILDMGGEKVPWNSPFIAILGAITVISGTLFYFIEENFAQEPIFPIKLLSHKAVVLSYLMFAVQISSQMAVRTNFCTHSLRLRRIAYALHSIILPNHKEFKSGRSGSVPRSISLWQYPRWYTQRIIR
jgi:hypothetical protein